MANISSASGKITLKGDWTQEAIAALELVLDMWEFYGEYGIQSYDGFDEEHLTRTFLAAEDGHFRAHWTHLRIGQEIG